MEKRKNASQWIQFGKDNSYTTSDGVSANFRITPNLQFIDIWKAGNLIDSYKLVSIGAFSMELQNRDGSFTKYKKDMKLISDAIKWLSTSRTDNLKGHWQSTKEPLSSIQFTEDGAVVFSDGSAGRYSIEGTEPDEVITLKLLKGEKRQFRILSLSSDQLVVSEDDLALSFRRIQQASKTPGKKSYRSESPSPGMQGSSTPAIEATNSSLAASAINTALDNSTATTDSVYYEDSSNEDDTSHEQSGNGGSKPKSFWGTVFSFITKYKCPKCGERSGELTHQERVSDREQIWVNRWDNAKKQTITVPIFRWEEEHSYTCENCKYTWIKLKERRGDAY